MVKIFTWDDAYMKEHKHLEKFNPVTVAYTFRSMEKRSVFENTKCWYSNEIHKINYSNNNKFAMILIKNELTNTFYWIQIYCLCLINSDRCAQPNQCAPMQSLVHSVWHTQHHSNEQPDRVHTICMHPPSRSVGVRHFGHGFDMTFIVILDASSHLASVARYNLQRVFKIQNKKRTQHQLSFSKQ